jgi:hypothetical protein
MREKISSVRIKRNSRDTKIALTSTARNIAKPSMDISVAPTFQRICKKAAPAAQVSRRTPTMYRLTLAQKMTAASRIIIRQRDASSSPCSRTDRNQHAGRDCSATAQVSSVDERR